MAERKLLSWMDARHSAAIARAKGFLLVAASPLTRSSYHAGDDFAKMKAAREAKLAVVR